MLKMLLKSTLAIVLCAALGLFVIDSRLKATLAAAPAESSRFFDGVFHNEASFDSFSWMRLFGAVKRQLTEEILDDKPTKTLPIETLSRADLEAIPDNVLRLFKLGHSTILIKAFGEYVLIDPMFSQRASPFSFYGPLRFQPTPIALDALPAIDTVLISHNHYDHLDKESIQALASNTQRFLVPLGVEGDLLSWGVAAEKVQAFDWWQEYKTADANFAFTPSQHFSGRGLSDRNTTLWGSWVMQFGDKRLYFSGDSGYFDGFKAIGEKYGPFDLTMLEDGAYNPDWANIHMMPEQAVQANLDLQGRIMLPIHNSTFDLSFHAWYEPLERASAAAEKQGVVLSTPIVGQMFGAETPVTEQWWKDYQ